MADPSTHQPTCGPGRLSPRLHPRGRETAASGVALGRTPWGSAGAAAQGRPACCTFPPSLCRMSLCRMPLPAPRRPLPRGCPRRRRQSPRAPRFIARRCRRRGPQAAGERRPDCTEPAGEARRELPPPALRTWAPLPSTAPGPAWRDRFSRPTCPTAGLRRAAPRSRLRHRGAAWG